MGLTQISESFAWVAISPGGTLIMPVMSDNHELFRWATSQGIEINKGIKYVDEPTKGRAIVAKRDLKAGEKLIFVPASCIITVDSDPDFLIKHFEHIRKATVHGQIVAKWMLFILSLADQSHPWIDMLPDASIVEMNAPVLWPQSFLPYLPPAARVMLIEQREKLDADIAAIDEAFGSEVCATHEMSREAAVVHYTYVWILVYTRTFYWDYEYPSFTAVVEGGKKYEAPPENSSQARKRVFGRPRNDCLALCPVIDGFNHDSQEVNCEATYTAKGYTATLSKDVKTGQELFVSYGSHSNDYLLIEYGFMLLEGNAHDSTMLDSEILPLLTTEQKGMLEDKNLLGNYTLTASGVCFRTQCALRLGLVTSEQWRKFVDGESDGAEEQNLVNQKLRSILENFVAEGKRKADKVWPIGQSPSGEMTIDDLFPLLSHQGTASRIGIRWQQIADMAESCMEAFATG